jgi:hypothetical protein
MAIHAIVLNGFMFVYKGPSLLGVAGIAGFVHGLFDEH